MLRIEDHGIGNDVRVPSTVHGIITLRGDNNKVVVKEPRSSVSICIELGHANQVLVEPDCVLGSLFLHADHDAQVTIGEGTGFNGFVRLLLHEPATLRVGAGCLFGGPTDLTVSDMHSIVSISDGRRINPPRDIIIGNRVSAGQNSIILKGPRIAPGSIIGAGSIVTGSIPANVVAAGNPVRVLRTGVTWRHELLPFVAAERKADESVSLQARVLLRLRRVRAFLRGR